MNRRNFGLAALCLALSTPAFAQGPVLQIHKDPSCGCCTAWADLARAAGYQVVATTMKNSATLIRGQ